ncbi:MAG: hypothetical protein K6U14_10895 [Firmicutes bacterium]|nr:hypothetical protein [Alicyclobacillaceae bacterium]MCL6498119.1 hypothetical protein [Bacillota bacterium]
MAHPLQMRTAQFVTTYGPGALLEGRLSRVIPRPDCDGLANWQATVQAFELDPGPLGAVLAKAGRPAPPRLFRVPSNPALGRDEQAVVYRTRPFPRWRLCWNRAAHPGRHVVLYPGRACPICRSENPDDLEAVRFVLACPAGHLDEVPWEQVAHDPAPRCPRAPGRSEEMPYYFWEGGGGSLRELRVRCPRCRQGGSLGRAFQREWTCRGRFPEQEKADAVRPVRPGGCSVPARLMQRGAAALRVADILTAFRIRTDALQACLERPAVRRAFEYVLLGRHDGSLSPEVLAAVCDRLLGDRELTAAEADAIRQAGPDRVLRLVRRVLTMGAGARTVAEIVRREFGELLSLAQPDAPPAETGATPQFATEQAMTVPWTGSGPAAPLRVVPAVRLESLLVQHAYRRLVPSQSRQSDPVDIGVPTEEGTWYPAVELQGEGLFLTGSPAPLDDGAWTAAAGNAAAWYAGKEFLFRGASLHQPDELSPLFVWWHSSPVATAITASKLVSPRVEDILAEARCILAQRQPSAIPEGEFWQWAFHPAVLHAVCQFREAFLEDCSSPVRLALRGIILGALHGPKQKTFPSYLSNQCPRTYAPKPAYAIRFWQHHRLLPEFVDVLAVIERRANRYYAHPLDVSGAVRLGDSRDAETLRPTAPGLRFRWVITSPPYYGMRTYIPDQWLRHWFVGGPDVVDYSRCNQLVHSSPDHFVDDLRRVWLNVKEVCTDDAIMVVRFGGIRDRQINPLKLIQRSLEFTGWRITRVEEAGHAQAGKRQADAFLRQKSEPMIEYDIWASRN